jgi:hypothetical protein
MERINKLIISITETREKIKNEEKKIDKNLEELKKISQEKKLDELNFETKLKQNFMYENSCNVCGKINHKTENCRNLKPTKIISDIKTEIKNIPEIKIEKGSCIYCRKNNHPSDKCHFKKTE